MRIELARELACPPEVAFTWVTDATAMNRWSEARIEPVLPGDGAHPAGVGARRDVILPPMFGRRARLEEVVVESESPRRFTYRVVGGAPVRRHEGRIRIEPATAGARLTWTVDVEVPVKVMEAGLRRTLVPSLTRSLDALARIASRWRIRASASRSSRLVRSPSHGWDRAAYRTWWCTCSGATSATTSPTTRTSPRQVGPDAERGLTRAAPVGQTASPPCG